LSISFVCGFVVIRAIYSCGLQFIHVDCDLSSRMLVPLLKEKDDDYDATDDPRRLRPGLSPSFLYHHILRENAT
jgi:hypothetical protein